MEMPARLKVLPNFGLSAGSQVREAFRHKAIYKDMCPECSQCSRGCAPRVTNSIRPTLKSFFALLVRFWIINHKGHEGRKGPLMITFVSFVVKKSNHRSARQRLRIQLLKHRFQVIKSSRHESHQIIVWRPIVVLHSALRSCIESHFLHEYILKLHGDARPSFFAVALW